MQIILNTKEDELISCSVDSTIVVWKVNCNSNQLEYDYTLEQKHTKRVNSISLNESETQLVSCSHDKQIILWLKGNNQRWVYCNHVVKDDYGFRICFIDNNQIAFQQWNQGITHFLKIENGKLLEDQPELSILFNNLTYDGTLFPTIFNKANQMIIQKHDKYVQIMRKQKNGKFQIESEPIDCQHHFNYGQLTKNGKYLVIWSQGTKEFRVYEISYG